jgi:hypothetical protein
MAKKKKQGCHFPSNPRFAVRISPAQDDLQALGDREMLSSRLLDCLIQRSAPPPDLESPFQVYLGSLGTRSYMQSCNALVDANRDSVSPKDWNRIQAKIKGIRSTFDRLFRDCNDEEASKRLIIPIVEGSHFYVLVVDFNFTYPHFFLSLEYYDSLRRSSRAEPEIHQGTPAFSFFVRSRISFSVLRCTIPTSSITSYRL